MEAARHPRQPFMQQQPVNVNSRKLIALIKSAYWIALLIIAAITMASFILLQQMMAEQQRDDALLTLASTQKALSQRVVFLAGATKDAPREEQLSLIASLRKAVAEFEANYDMLLERTNADHRSPALFDPRSIESVLFGMPYHIDLFSTELAANGWRLISALETELGVPGADYRAGKETAVLDETVANATLEGFTALGQRIGA
ncbi:MAG: GGDEF-domain containing protein, partial [Mesorhizobium sp.]|nr:GGDEF-domain containing protein [Mesorhizobium sp.]